MALNELYSGKVLRLVLQRWVLDSNSGLPFLDAFAPSQVEREKRPIRISVWDASRTTIHQLFDLTSKTRDEAVPFSLDVSGVRSVKVQGVQLRVVRDPLGAQDKLKAGSNGHCGIEGLGEDLCTDAGARKMARSSLARLAKRVEPSTW